MPGKALVIDANILIRAVLGKGVFELIERYAARVLFVVPAIAYSDAEEHVTHLAITRRNDPQTAIALLHSFYVW